ncbi:phosphatase PAP2 family protein [Candidatus Peribacteria bacterium]|nr:phosphatase PAP2 family protein [Candidatus Peribacteria bacterium]
MTPADDHEEPLLYTFFVRSPKKHTLFLSLTLSVIAVILFLPSIIENQFPIDTLVASDKTIAMLLFLLRHPHLLLFFYGITLLCSASMLLATVMLLSIVLWVRNQHTFILTLFLTLLTGEGAMLIGKIFFRRQRPDLLFHAVSETTFSFPSGHATTAAAFFGFLAYVLLRTKQTKTTRVIGLLIAILLILLLDMSRLYLGVHYLSDVIAGNLIGLAALLFAIGITEHRIAVKKIRIPDLPIADIALVLLAETIVILGIVLLFVPPWL